MLLTDADTVDLIKRNWGGAEGNEKDDDRGNYDGEDDDAATTPPSPTTAATAASVSEKIFIYPHFNARARTDPSK